MREGKGSDQRKSGPVPKFLGRGERMANRTPPSKTIQRKKNRKNDMARYA